ncbi:eCIS core domain-containing protein [Nostoc sp. CALU 1950]|uniref:eCIS core domain-containing protein n=1 Tax=Nostoc sp. CALU 1950 TaxID=3104321 RepID=UPI003EC0051D
MREHVSRQKKTTTGFSIPSLKNPTPGFGLESSAISRQAVPKIQPLDKPLTHDISCIPLRSQAKLSISQPGDIYEQEADSVAQQVMQRMAQPVNSQSIQREALPEEEEELQMKSLDNSTLQREALPEDEEELQMKPMMQRQSEAGMAAAPDLEASINQARGGGQIMADNIREPMEQAFGADFSGVKVHTDGQSDQLNRSIQARAFTTGQDVFFRQGEYNPGSRGGQELLAHELTHVVQQNGVLTKGIIQRKEVTELVNSLETVMVEGKLKKEQIIDGLKQLDESDRNDPNFARALVDFVKARNQKEFKIEDLTSQPDPKFGKKHLDKKWTFRHYTTQKYESLQSLAQLEAKGIEASKNTNDRDWEDLGNQGYVFGLIAIDGEVPNRTWLSNMKYYAEYDLKKLDSVWVSGDMLTDDGRKQNSYQGTGINIVYQLSKMLGFINQNSANELDGKFKNALEAKVSPASLGSLNWTDV